MLLNDSHLTIFHLTWKEMIHKQNIICLKLHVFYFFVLFDNNQCHGCQLKCKTSMKFLSYKTDYFFNLNGVFSFKTLIVCTNLNWKSLVFPAAVCIMVSGSGMYKMYIVFPLKKVSKLQIIKKRKSQIKESHYNEQHNQGKIHFRCCIKA